MLHYILNNDGYLKAVFLGCMSEGCNVWEGDIPDDLEENLGAYKFGTGENIILDLEYTENMGLNDLGEEVEKTDYIITDFFPIYYSREYSYNNNNGENTYGAYYDEDYNFISSFLIGTEGELSIPEGASYVRFTLLKAEYETEMPINNGDDLSGKAINCDTYEIVKNEYDTILTTSGGYSIKTMIMGEEKSVWVENVYTDFFMTLYSDTEDLLPYTMPSDTGTVTAIYTDNSNSSLFTIKNTNVFNLYSTNELILDEAKLEEIQNNIPYDYSINEVFTGKYWVNGKPIYRKVLLVGTVGLDEVSTPVNISNLSNIIKIEGGGYMNNGNFLNWNFENGRGFVSTYYNANSKNMRSLVSYADYTLYDAFIILEYVKTTD